MNNQTLFWSKEHGTLSAFLSTSSPYNYAWLCPQCGEIFLRRFIPSLPWFPISSLSPCQTCSPHSYYQPRRFEDPYEPELIDLDLAAIEFFLNSSRIFS
jgi:hypothetical protein